ncbi:MAG: DEAD/DEAH box helicase [Sphingomonadales bacterium]|nr:DEAD/DEAH box helicase [Sphingomonadales bacterium]
MSFEFLGLSEGVLGAVADAGYVDPTPIQAAAIPGVLMGRDILGIAQTGTGKTASFTLPMIDILASGRAKARMPRSLILEPTRELAAQVSENFETYGKNHKLTMALLIGGVSFADQDARLERGADVLIATPGRLLDHFERGKLLLSGVEILVVDEADRMLDMGFIPDVERICSLMPQKHQTLFFSATMPPPIKRLTDKFLNEPKVVEVARPATAAETVEQARVTVAVRDKRAALRSLLESENVKNAIIFCNRKKDVDVIHVSLKRHGFEAVALHGDMDQHERMKVLAAFKDGEAKLLVASDVAARGLDIAAVSHVFNFDVPTHAEDYVHRIGRTGRAGRAGRALTIGTPGDAKYIAAIEKLTGQRIEQIPVSGVKSAAASTKDGRKDRKTPAKEKSGAAEGPSRKPKSRGRGESDRGKKTREKTKDKGAREKTRVVGLGDHTPGFLSRPVTRQSKPQGKSGKTAGDKSE